MISEMTNTSVRKV